MLWFRQLGLAFRNLGRHIAANPVWAAQSVVTSPLKLVRHLAYPTCSNTPSRRSASIPKARTPASPSASGASSGRSTSSIRSASPAWPRPATTRSIASTLPASMSPTTA